MLFCGHGLKFFFFFHSEEVPILKQHIISCHIFSAQYPKGNAKAPLWIIPQGPILVFVALSAWEYLFIFQTNMY